MDRLSRCKSALSETGYGTDRGLPAIASRNTCAAEGVRRSIGEVSAIDRDSVSARSPPLADLDAYCCNSRDSA